MKNLCWHEKPGVKILEGKWQDFVESEELLSVSGFDVIYTDTFSEDYKGEETSSQCSNITHESGDSSSRVFRTCPRFTCWTRIKI